MTTRESLHALLNEMSDQEIEELWARLIATSEDSGLSAPESDFLDLREYPALASVWDNDDDAVFDDM